MKNYMFLLSLGSIITAYAFESTRMSDQRMLELLHRTRGNGAMWLSEDVKLDKGDKLEVALYLHKEKCSRYKKSLQYGFCGLVALIAPFVFMEKNCTPTAEEAKLHCSSPNLMGLTLVTGFITGSVLFTKARISWMEAGELSQQAQAVEKRLEEA